MTDLTKEDLEAVLVAGVEEIRSYPFNGPLNQFGDVMQKMALALGTGQMEASVERQREKDRERIRKMMERSP